MATPYSDVFDVFLEKITDYDLPALSEIDRKVILNRYMIASCNKFNRICNSKSKINLLNKDDILMQFNQDLNSEIIDIITEGMIVEWLKPKYYLDENMKNYLNTKDYNMAASPANMLNNIRSTYNEAKRTYKNLINDYSYVYGKIEDLKND